ARSAPAGGAAALPGSARSPPPSDRPPGPLRVALALAAFALADPDPGALAVFGVEQHHVGDGDRPPLLDDAADLRRARRVLDRARPFVALDDVEALAVDAPALRLGPGDAARLAAVLAADHVHFVALADVHRLRHQRTSGASETI